MSGTFLRRRDRTARPPRVVHYSSAVNTFCFSKNWTVLLDTRRISVVVRSEASPF